MKKNSFKISFANFILSVLFLSSCQNELNNNIKIEEKNEKQKLVETFRAYADYNYWANSEFANWLMEKDTSLVYDSVPSSFTTIRQNIVHLWKAEIGWLQTLKGETWNIPKDLDKNIAFNDLLIEFKEQSKKLKSYIDTISSEKLVSRISLTKSDVNFDEILIHIINHASFHRGQIITIGRNLGIVDPPRTDFIYFISSIN